VATLKSSKKLNGQFEMKAERLEKLLGELPTYINFCEEEKEQAAIAACSFLASKYQYVGLGLYRIVFKVGTHMFKFPLNEGGEYCNDGEGSIRHANFARGRYIEWRGFICVMQETLRMPTNNEFAHINRSPKLGWVCGIDSQQVGYDLKGRLKAYDFVHP
jgi:hypothetical protein